MSEPIFSRATRMLALALGTASLLTACKDASESITVAKTDFTFQALTASNQLLALRSTSLGTAATPVAITGLQSGERILSIDYRPATGQLYGLGSSSRLYVINPASGVARQVGSGAFTPALAGTSATIDFNPTVDRLRVVSNTGQNLRLNPETGAVAATDGAINGVATAAITGAAYTNNTAGAATTVLYDIDPATDRLYRQDPPNDGTLVAVGDLGVNATQAGFDIAADGGKAFATLTVDAQTGLYEVDLATGRATRYDNFASGTTVVDLAIPTLPVAYGVDSDNNFVAFNPTASTQTPVSKAFTGLQSGERIVGLDMRPLTGQLYGLGSTNRLYTINMASGAAVAVGSTPLVLTGTNFGLDFNPTVDRLRIVSDTGVNLRVNPADGVAIVDGPLNPGTPNVTGAAYTNNFAGATTTVLYDIDSTTDQLYRQDPPNNGTLVAVGPLGVNVAATNGFDIGGTSGTAYVVLTVGSTSSVYSLNLTSGAATKGIDLPRSLQAMALGLGF